MRNQKWLACCMSIEIVEIDNIEMWRVEKDRQQTTDNRQAQELRNQIIRSLTDLSLCKNKWGARSAKLLSAVLLHQDALRESYSNFFSFHVSCVSCVLVALHCAANHATLRPAESLNLSHLRESSLRAHHHFSLRIFRLPTHRHQHLKYLLSHHSLLTNQRARCASASS
jgi:hypothetical protein